MRNHLISLRTGAHLDIDAPQDHYPAQFSDRWSLARGMCGRTWSWRMWTTSQVLFSKFLMTSPRFLDVSMSHWLSTVRLHSRNSGRNTFSSFHDYADHWLWSMSWVLETRCKAILWTDSSFLDGKDTPTLHPVTGSEGEHVSVGLHLL